MTDNEGHDSKPESKYAKLPEPVRPADMVEEQATELPPDPDGGRNPNNEFMLRYAG